MKRRYSIWGREWGADHDVELAQVNNDPETVIKAFEAKTLKIKHSIFERGKRTSNVRKFSGLRIVENV